MVTYRGARLFSDPDLVCGFVGDSADLGSGSSLAVGEDGHVWEIFCR